ncbi:unnamed protein product [Leuciscus chuanchicus]
MHGVCRLNGQFTRYSRKGDGGWDQKQHPCEFYDLGMSEESCCGAAGEERGRVAGFQSRTNASYDPHVGDAHIKPNIDGKRPWRCMCAGGDGKTCEVKGTNPKEPRAPEAIMSLSGNSCELVAQHLTVSDLPACSTTGGGTSSRKPGSSPVPHMARRDELQHTQTHTHKELMQNSVDLKRIQTSARSQDDIPAKPPPLLRSLSTADQYWS